MITETVDEKELFVSLDETWNELIHLISSTGENIINKIPFANSWTAAQLATHIIKSNTGMATVLKKEGKTAERDPAEGAAKMKKIFLDFTAKYNAPEFIIPEDHEYQKELLLNDLADSIRQLKEEYSKQNLSQLLTVEIFGEVTKLELYYFVLYHTQRHIRQLKNILKTLAAQ
jgi:hypothetical protein